MEIAGEKSTQLIYKRNGIILCTDRYEASVNFYSRILDLPILFVLNNEHSKLTCLELGGNYLMVEACETASTKNQSCCENRFCFRFNVDNVETTADELAKRGVKVTVRNEVWGTVGEFWDPDGNRCSLRDERTFIQQISNEA